MPDCCGVLPPKFLQLTNSTVVDVNHIRTVSQYADKTLYIWYRDGSSSWASGKDVLPEAFAYFNLVPR